MKFTIKYYSCNFPLLGLYNIQTFTRRKFILERGNPTSGYKSTVFEFTDPGISRISSLIDVIYNIP